MAANKVLEGTEAEIGQVGVVVKDLDKTMEYLTSLGFGPFIVRTVTHPSGKVRGKKGSYQIKVALSQQGPVQIELIEWQKGNTIYNEFLEKKGEGLHHIRFKVRDLNATLAKFSKMGIEVLMEDRWVEGGGIAYMGTDKIGGILMEFVQYPPDHDPAKGVRYE